MIIKTFIVVIIFIMSCGFAFADGPWKGKILDVETKEPLEGVVVLAVWDRIYRTPFGTSSYFYEAKETASNKEGEFEIPSYTPINMLPIISYMQGPEFTIFKPGYGSLRMSLGDYLNSNTKKPQEMELLGKKYRFESGIIELPRLIYKEERLRNIPGGPTDVGDDKLPFFYKSINEERINLGIRGSVKK